MITQHARARTEVWARSKDRSWIKPLASAVMLSAAALLSSGLAAQSEELTKSHGYSYFGNLDYPADFEHFAYADPDAPKGGELSLSQSGTFDSLNPYSRKGRPGVLTSIQYDTLMVSSDDTIGQYYGLLAESVEYDAGRNFAIFTLRDGAEFWDGTPVTAEDVVYSHTLFITQGLPSYAQAVSFRVTGAEALDARHVKFTFNPEVSRRSLIETVANTPVFKKAWFEEDLENRRLDEPRLEVAIGSGPYKLESYDINRQIVYKRRDDYWAKDLPVNKGRNNFDTIRVEYFADQTGAFEAFKAGEFTFRQEGDPKNWATGYDFPKMNEGAIVKEAFPNGSPPNPTGFVFNLGFEPFKDQRLRRAMALAFNFEWTNESLQFGLKSQRTSFVEGTPLMAKGVPEGAELAFLKTLGDTVPERLLTEPLEPSHTSGAARLNDRRNLRKATKLLQEAGWTVGDDAKLRNEAGEELVVRMPYPTNIQSSTAALIENYAKNLQALGIDARPEKIDPAQYTERRRNRDYEFLYSSRYGSFLSTGGGLSQMYGSKEAEFSLFNPAGLADPLVDAIIEKSFYTTNQAEQDAALMALDRVLQDKFFVVPTGYTPDIWVAHYDMYGHPEQQAPYAFDYMSLWWVDTEKEAALKASGALR